MKAVFLGRFQPFHKGHYFVVKDHRDDYEEFAVALGSPGKSRTRENPLNAEERKEIIHACFPEIDLFEVEDEDRGKEGYPAWTQRLVEETGAGIILSGNDLVKRLVREYSDAEVLEIEHHEPDHFSGTEIRRRIREGEEWEELVPDCCLEEVKSYEKIIREAG
ncbi:MAG: adenylyltransferase/cytidyltransferase family protein [Candidatus Nanohaloarchaea archaeon]